MPRASEHESDKLNNCDAFTAQYGVVFDDDGRALLWPKPKRRPFQRDLVLDWWGWTFGGGVREIPAFDVLPLEELAPKGYSHAAYVDWDWEWVPLVPVQWPDGVSALSLARQIFGILIRCEDYEVYQDDVRRILTKSSDPEAVLEYMRALMDMDAGVEISDAQAEIVVNLINAAKGKEGVSDAVS